MDAPQLLAAPGLTSLVVRWLQATLACLDSDREGPFSSGDGESSFGLPAAGRQSLERTEPRRSPHFKKPWKRGRGLTSELFGPGCSDPGAEPEPPWLAARLGDPLGDRAAHGAARILRAKAGAERDERRSPKISSSQAGRAARWCLGDKFSHIPYSHLQPL